MARLLHRLGMFCARRPLVMIGVWGRAAGRWSSVRSRPFGSQTNNDLTLPGTGSQDGQGPARRSGSRPSRTAPTRSSSTSRRASSPTRRTSRRSTTSVKAIKKQPHVYSVTNPLSSAGQTAGLLSKDKQTAFAPVLMDVGSGDLTDEIAQNVMDATEAGAGRRDHDVAAAGSIGIDAVRPTTSETSEIVGIIAAMIILSLVLGSLVAMGLPIITAVVGLGVALAVVGLVGHARRDPVQRPDPGHDDRPRRRHRLRALPDHPTSGAAAGRHADARLDRHAVATSGSAIVFAGGTVVIALLSLGVAGIPLVSALGLASAIAVVTAVLGAITLLPGVPRPARAPDPLGSAAGVPAPDAKPGEGHVAPLGRRRTPPPGAGQPWCRWRSWCPLIIPAFSLELGQEDIGATAAVDHRAPGLRPDHRRLRRRLQRPAPGRLALEPAATPSAEYTKKYNKATSLKKRARARSRRSCPSSRSSSSSSRSSSRPQQAALERSRATQLQGRSRPPSSSRQRPAAGRSRRRSSSRATSSSAAAGAARGPEGAARARAGRRSQRRAEALAAEIRAARAASWPRSRRASGSSAQRIAATRRANPAPSGAARRHGWPGSRPARRASSESSRPLKRQAQTLAARPAELAGAGRGQLQNQADAAAAPRPTQLEPAEGQPGGRPPRSSSRATRSRPRPTSSSSRATRSSSRATSSSSRPTSSSGAEAGPQQQQKQAEAAEPAHRDGHHGRR